MPLNIPNILSLFRIVAAPFLILTGWLGMPEGFFILFGLMLLSDALDGYVARKMNQTSKLGARLDSYGDIVTYLSIPIAAWWLWPDIIRHEFYYIVTVISIYILPAFFAYAKFGKLVSYHTWLTKLSAVLMSIGIVLLFGFENNILFHIAVYVVVLEMIENIAITFILPEPMTNINSVWHALQKSKK